MKYVDKIAASSANPDVTSMNQGTTGSSHPHENREKRINQKGAETLEN